MKYFFSLSKVSLLFFIALSLTPPSARADSFWGGLVKAVSDKLDGLNQANVASKAPKPDCTPTPETLNGGSGTVSTDSSFTITGDFPPETRLLSFDVYQDGKTDKPAQVFVSLSKGGHVVQKIYLSHGAGKYTVNIFSSSNPSRFQDPGGWTFSKTVQIANTDTRDNSYLLPSGDVQSDDAGIIAQAKALVTPEMDDMAKAKAIHDWITSNIQYDAASYFDESYKGKVYDATSAFYTHQSICYGYSNLFAAMARAVGLRAKVVNGAIIWPTLGQSWAAQGQSQEHAWNEVLVNGQWITLDTTWDSGNMDFKTKTFTQAPHADYFNPQASAFALDHQKLYDDINN